jgi:hypothetical protein
MFREFFATMRVPERLRSSPTSVGLTTVYQSRKTHANQTVFSGLSESRHFANWAVPAGQALIHYSPSGSGTAIAMPKAVCVFATTWVLAKLLSAAIQRAATQT